MKKKKWQLKIFIYQVPQEIKEVDLQNIRLVFSVYACCFIYYLSILSCRISLLRCMKRKLYAVDTPISMPPIESFEVWSNAVIIIFNYQEFLLLLIK